VTGDCPTPHIRGVDKWQAELSWFGQNAGCCGAGAAGAADKERQKW
jgi:hypothetical protein